MTQPSRTTENDASAASPAADAARPEGAIATALGRIPSGLFIVSWRDGDSDRTMLASWVMQAGFAPPAVTLAVAVSRDLLAAIAAGTPFVVNILGESQRPLLARFGRPATPGEDPFAGLDIVRSPGGAAALVAAAAWLECRGTAQAAAGDHVIVVAEVTAAGGGSGEPALVHTRRNGLRY
jgi:flavin reductase (DIM6/NTAB) family NADH-FMN oxidoreductase RutF